MVWSLVSGRWKRTYLPLGGEVTVTSGNTKDEPIELGELFCSDDGVVGLGGCVHLAEDVLRESLRNPGGEETVSLYAGATDATETHWKMETEPPASSTPFLTDSATG